MQHRTRRLAIALGGSLLALIGLAVAACSTDNGTTTPLPGQTDSGRPAKDTGSSTDDDDSGSTVTPQDAGADCSAAPKPRSNSGVYCFKGTDTDDGGSCSPAENKVCCADAKDGTGQFVKAKCAVATVAAEGYEEGSCAFDPDAGGREWHCTEKKHCPNAGEVCCVTAGTKGTPKAIPDTKEFPGCGNFFNGDQGANVGGTRCRADSCQAGELTLCASDADCAKGTCHFFELANRRTGVCQ